MILLACLAVIIIGTGIGIRSTRKSQESGDSSDSTPAASVNYDFDAIANGWLREYGIDMGARGRGATYRDPGSGREIIGIASATLIYSQSDGFQNMTQSVFDTTSRPDGAEIKLTNSSGSTITLKGVAIRGNPVLRYSGSQGYINDDLIDYEDINKNGQREQRVANDYIVTLDQVNQLADLMWKYNRGKKHGYVITLPGTRHHFDIGEWYTVTIGGVGQKEYINSTCILASKIMERTAEGLGGTVLAFFEVEENWKMTSNATARFIANGGINSMFNKSNIVTVGSSDWAGYADIVCNGTNDEVEIQEAIDDVNALGGGMVQLLGKTFYVGTAAIAMKSNVILEGNSTTIEKNLNDYAIEGIGSDGSELVDITIQNCKFTRNVADTNTKALCYFTYCDNLLMQNCVVDDGYYEGISLLSCDDMKIVNNKIKNTDFKGILIETCTGIVQGNMIIGSIETYVFTGIYASDTTALCITNNIIRDITGSPTITGILVGGTASSYNTVASNSIENLQSYTGTVDGITFSGGNCSGNGNYIKNLRHFSSLADGSVGISVNAGGSDTLLTGNYCIDNGNLIDRGNCESTTAPMMFGETVPLLSTATWARDNTQVYEGTYSYKFIKTSSAGTNARAFLTDNNGLDMHGLIAGVKYTWVLQLYIPAASGIVGTEISITMYDNPGGGSTTTTAVNTYDAWQTVTLTKTIDAGATRVYFYIQAASTAAQNEYFYIDNTRLYEVGISNNHSTNYSDSGTNTYPIGNSWQGPGA